MKKSYTTATLCISCILLLLSACSKIRPADPILGSWRLVRYVELRVDSTTSPIDSEFTDTKYIPNLGFSITFKPYHILDVVDSANEYSSNGHYTGANGTIRMSYVYKFAPLSFSATYAVYGDTLVIHREASTPGESYFDRMEYYLHQ